jgi:uncharacterized protein (DUF1697 family)
MPRFVVLLRGVNVGKGNRVAMTDFKSLLEGLGYTDVATLLNSGNAAFSSSGRSATKHAAAIASGLQRDLRVSALVIVKTAADLAAIVEGNPIRPPESEHSRFLVAFGPDEAALRGLAPLQALARAPERFVITREAAFLHCPGGLLESKVGKTLLGTAGKSVTTRNWATVLKLHALASANAA